MQDYILSVYNKLYRDNYKSEHLMPAKHIDDKTWREVEKETLKVVMGTKKIFKETEILKAVILKGLATIELEEYEEILLKNKKKD